MIRKKLQMEGSETSDTSFSEMWKEAVWENKNSLVGEHSAKYLFI